MSRRRLYPVWLAVITLVSIQAAAQARPVNFQQDGQGRDIGDGRLRFTYTWDSSTGMLADLNNCQTGENVTYPNDRTRRGSYFYNNPPYAQDVRSRNPTVIWLPAVRGRFIDTHRPPRNDDDVTFLRPYRDDSVTATQDYRWRCTNINNNQATNFANFVGIQIVRTVANTLRNPADNCWFYTVAKARATAEIRPLPNAGPCAGERFDRSEVNRTAAHATPGAENGASFSVVNPSVLHEPVFIQFEFHNSAAEAVNFDLGLNGDANFEVAVTQPNGATTVRRLRSDGLGFSGETTVAPGESFSGKLLLNQWNDLSTAGDYRVKITLLSPITTESGAVLAMQPSQQLYLHVGERDESKLNEIARGLADTALTAPDIAERMNAALTLSYMNDPIVVPELARVLQQGTFLEQYAIEGLGRIATPQAIAVLWSATAYADPEVRSFARFTLDQIGGDGAPEPTD